MRSRHLLSNTNFTLNTSTTMDTISMNCHTQINSLGTSPVVIKNTPRPQRVNCQVLISILSRFFPAGRTTIGTAASPVQQDVVIQGFGIESEHCYLEHEDDGDVYLHPVALLCAVDGLQIHKPIKLQSGKVWFIYLS